MMSERFWGTGAVGWAAIAAIGVLATLVVAVIAASVALGQLRESRRLAREQARPYVVVDFEPNPASNHLRDFVIRNVGHTAAYGVSISWDPQPVEANEIAGHRFQDIRAFNEPTPMLAPGRELRFFFDLMIDRNNRGGIASLFEVTVEYRSSDARGADEFREVAKLDLDSMKGASFIDIKKVHHLVQEIEKLRKVLERSAIADRPIETITEARADFVARERQRYDAVARQDGLARMPRQPKLKRRG